MNTNYISIILAIVLFLALPAFTFAAPGDVDPTFTAGVGANSTVRAVAVQPDGKVIILGSFDQVNGVARTRIARLNADGTLDTTFDTSVGANDEVFAVAIQPDGKIVIGGRFRQVNGVTRNRIARLNADGTLDTTFDTRVVSEADGVRAVAVAPDGKVIIGGSFFQVNGVTRNSIARLNADGSLDTTFDTRVGGFFGIVNAVAVQHDGKVIIGGLFTMVNNVTRLGIARLQGCIQGHG